MQGSRLIGPRSLRLCLYQGAVENKLMEAEQAGLPRCSAPVLCQLMGWRPCELANASEGLVSSLDGCISNFIRTLRGSRGLPSVAARQGLRLTVRWCEFSETPDRGLVSARSLPLVVQRALPKLQKVPWVGSSCPGTVRSRSSLQCKRLVPCASPRLGRVWPPHSARTS